MRHFRLQSIHAFDNEKKVVQKVLNFLSFVQKI